MSVTRRVMGPFNRVEGDLQVKLDIEEGLIRDAWVIAPMYRGFEQILSGKPAQDALVIAPRICGICSVAQSVAAASTLQNMTGTTMPANGQHAINLMLATENLADHFTHFYLFFMPDFAREAYRHKSWWPQAGQRFKAVTGNHARRALQARAELLNMMGILAGKWPHSLAIQPGGSTRAIEKKEKMRLLSTLRAFRSELEEFTFQCSLEEITAIQSSADLEYWQHGRQGPKGDLGVFLQISDDLKLREMGVSKAAFLSYGAYRHAQTGFHAAAQAEQHHFSSGIYQAQKAPVDFNLITEDVSHAWYKPAPPGHPQGNSTETGIPVPGASNQDPDAPYSWCKAPRYQDQVCETGALARQMVDQNPLALELVRSHDSNVQNRVLMRLWEMARVVQLMEQWVKALQPGEPFCHETDYLQSGKSMRGLGVVEAARGSLGHWASVEDGHISRYQIVAPTTWNFSPRDHRATPGALEQALIGTRVGANESNPLAAQHIVRSYDPCMSCTVH